MSNLFEGVEIISKYFPDLNPIIFNQFERLKELYSDWNSKINVISRKDIDNIYIKHVLHSLAIAKIIRFKNGTQILDVGTGGGFPGIPLAILFPGVNFHLVDSIGKKIKVVTEVANALELKNVSAEQIRVENISRKFDFVVSRAVTEFNQFYAWVNKLIHKDNRSDIQNGILYLKGGDLGSELASFKKQVQLYEISSYFKEEFFATKKIVYLPIK